MKMSRGGLTFVLVVLAGGVCSILSMGSGVKGSSSSHRVSRDASYSLDLMVLVDHATYRAWYDRTDTSLSIEERWSTTMVDIRRYFTVVIREVTGLYADLGTTYPLNFRPVIFYIDDQDSNPWIVTTPFGRVDSQQTMNKVSLWLQFNSNSSQYDHVVLFIGGDLATDNEGHTTGRSTVGTLCSGSSSDSLSVIEDRGAFQSIFTLAHELAHSLNAIHDGTGNNVCLGTEGYIMAAGTGDVSEDKLPHKWRFSTCSENEMSAFVDSLSASQVTSCLERALPQAEDVPDVTGVVPGQLYDRDDQCRHLYGPLAEFCFFGDLSDICTQMPCRDPLNQDSRLCNLHVAATGTTCGNNKWCQEGACVQSAQAPAIESCVSDEAVRVNGMSCPQMATTQPALCYDVEIFTKCCKSCTQADSGVKGCPYGDKKTGCTSQYCHKIRHNGDIVDDECCETCHFDLQAWQCRDDDDVIGDCDVAAKGGYLQGCYNLTLAYYCCDTCRKERRLDRGEGCEYGDKLLQGCSRPSQDSCDTTSCCLTCSTDGPTDTGSTTQRPLSAMTIISLTVLIISL